MRINLWPSPNTDCPETLDVASKENKQNTGNNRDYRVKSSMNCVCVCVCLLTDFFVILRRRTCRGERIMAQEVK